MRLGLKHSSKPVKTEKQKKINKEKKSKGPKINSNYSSTEVPNLAMVSIDATKLNYGYLEKFTLHSVEVNGEHIELKDSWIGFIVLLLSYLIDNEHDTFRDKLIQNNVTSQHFIVDKMYGVCTFDKRTDTMVYNIYDTGYYLEAIFNNSNIFSAIIGLLKCMDITLDSIQFNLKNLDYKDIELNFDQLEEEESVVTINGVSSMLKDGIHMVAIQILDVTTKVHRLDVALVVFCNWAYDTYGQLKLLSLPESSSTGICLESNKEGKLCTPLRGSMMSVYTDGDTEGIIKFIKESMKKLEIGEDKVKFKFRALKAKDKLKEWEVE